MKLNERSIFCACIFTDNRSCQALSTDTTFFANGYALHAGTSPELKISSCTARVHGLRQTCLSKPFNKQQHQIIPSDKSDYSNDIARHTSAKFV